MKRILVWGLANYRGGTEQVIYNYTSHIPSDIAVFDFLCYEKPIIYSSLFDHTESRYHIVPIKIKHPIQNKIALERFFKKNALLYDALWFNINDMSNIDPLILAKKYGIKHRIVHMHNSNISSRLITQVFSKLNKKKCCKLATEKWACSKTAGKFLYDNQKFMIIPNLIDSEKFKFNKEKRFHIRSQFNISNDFVVGTVGRLSETKNSKYLVSLLPDLLKENPNTTVMFVGEGSIKDEIANLANELKVRNHVIFAGAQDDTQAFYSAFDVFALPSLYEGLPLVVLEAQFNGLPCIISLGSSDECIISSNVKRISCNDSRRWVSAIINSERKTNSIIEKRANKFELSSIRPIASKLFGTLS